MKTGSVQKAIILAGGTGGRLDPITRGAYNKVNIEVHRHPLLAYLLKTLEENGVREVALVVRPDHQQEFEQLIRSGKYPRSLKYTIIHTPFRESGYRTTHMLGKVFQDKAFLQFAGRQPVAVLFGDTFYFPKFFKRALADFNSKKRPVFLASPEYTTTEHDGAFHEETVESHEFAQRKYSPAISGFFSTPEFFQFLHGHSGSTVGMMGILASAHKQGFRTAVMHGQLININNPADYIGLREVLAGKLRFPYPRNWVRSYRAELERITHRAEGRQSYRNRLIEERKKFHRG